MRGHPGAGTAAGAAGRVGAAVTVVKQPFGGRNNSTGRGGSIEAANSSTKTQGLAVVVVHALFAAAACCHAVLLCGAALCCCVRTHLHHPLVHGM